MVLPGAEESHADAQHQRCFTSFHCSAQQPPKATHPDGTMYGVLLESVQHFVQLHYGEEVWSRVMEEAGLKNVVFTTHTKYR